MSVTATNPGILYIKAKERLAAGTLQDTLAGLILLPLSKHYDQSIQKKKFETLAYIQSRSDEITFFVCSETTMKLAKEYLPITAKACFKFTANAAWSKLKATSTRVYTFARKVITGKEPEPELKKYPYFSTKGLKLLKEDGFAKKITGLFYLFLSIFVDPFIFVLAPVKESLLEATKELTQEIAMSREVFGIIRKCLPRLAYNAIFC